MPSVNIALCNTNTINVYLNRRKMFVGAVSFERVNLNSNLPTLYVSSHFILH